MKFINKPAHIFITAQIILLIVKSCEILPRGMKIVPSRRRVRSPRSKISGIQGNYLKYSPKLVSIHPPPKNSPTHPPR